MKNNNHSSTGNSTNGAEPTSNRSKSSRPSDTEAIRTSGREYVNPVDYKHPFDSMSQFADFLALRYDANRTRHAYYRQLRLIHEHCACDPAIIVEPQLRDYFLFIKLKKHWKPKTIRQAVAAACVCSSTPDALWILAQCLLRLLFPHAQSVPDVVQPCDFVSTLRVCMEAVALRSLKCPRHQPPLPHENRAKQKPDARWTHPFCLHLAK
jgi:hypothetical protein